MNHNFVTSSVSRWRSSLFMPKKSNFLKIIHSQFFQKYSKTSERNLRKTILSYGTCSRTRSGRERNIRLLLSTTGMVIFSFHFINISVIQSFLPLRKIVFFTCKNTICFTCENIILHYGFLYLLCLQ